MTKIERRLRHRKRIKKILENTKTCMADLYIHYIKVHPICVSFGRYDWIYTDGVKYYKNFSLSENISEDELRNKSNQKGQYVISALNNREKIIKQTVNILWHKKIPKVVMDIIMSYEEFKINIPPIILEPKL